MLNKNTRGLRDNWHECPFLPQILICSIFLHHGLFSSSKSLKLGFWKIPQIALYTIPHGFHKNPVIGSTWVPLDRSYPGVTDLLANGSGINVKKTNLRMVGALCVSAVLYLNQIWTRDFGPDIADSWRLHYKNEILQFSPPPIHFILFYWIDPLSSVGKLF
jgi:hypothetical protein